MRRHSSSVTGITDRRDIRTSGKDANVLSALMDARVTTDFNFFTGATSIAYCFPVLSAGSGYGADAAFAIHNGLHVSWVVVENAIPFTHGLKMFLCERISSPFH